MLRIVVILIEANIVAYVGKDQIQYRPHRNRSRDSLSKYTVYVATTRKSCRAWTSNAYLSITSARTDYLTVLTFFPLLYNKIKNKSSRWGINREVWYGFFIFIIMIIMSGCCLIVIKRDWFLQVLGYVSVFGLDN